MSARWKYLITLIALALVLGGIVVISGPSQADIIVQNGASQPIARIWVAYPGGDAVLSEPLARGAERHVAIEVGEATYSLEIMFSDGRRLSVRRYVQGGNRVLEVVSDSGITPRYGGR